MDNVRILRIIEYTGPRDVVELQVAKSIHGEKRIGGVVIRATTLGEFPEIMEIYQTTSRPPNCDPMFARTGR